MIEILNNKIRWHHRFQCPKCGLIALTKFRCLYDWLTYIMRQLMTTYTVFWTMGRCISLPAISVLCQTKAWSGIRTISSATCNYRCTRPVSAFVIRTYHTLIYCFYSFCYNNASKICKWTLMDNS